MMTAEGILLWLQGAPVLEGKPINLEYLPAYGGWSLSLPRTQVKTDILGNVRQIRTLKLSRRCSPAGNGDRMAVLEEMEALTDWVLAHPPENAHVSVVAAPVFVSRTPAGTEDFEIEIKVQSEKFKDGEGV